jgi:hypothetical protein
MSGHEITLVFLVAMSLSSIATLFFLCRIAKNVYQAQAKQKRKLSILFGAPQIIRAHQELFPNHESMLWFWLSLITLLIWLSGLLFRLLDDTEATEK